MKNYQCQTQIFHLIDSLTLFATQQAWLEQPLESSIQVGKNEITFELEPILIESFPEILHECKVQPDMDMYHDFLVQSILSIYSPDNMKNKEEIRSYMAQFINNH